VGPVQLECTIRFHRELRRDDEVDVSCVFVWGDGKTFRTDQEYRRPDGVLVAELTCVCGLLDLTERRLVADPDRHLRSLAAAPEALGLCSSVCQASRPFGEPAQTLEEGERKSGHPSV
jgi:acyl-CoA thioester hydrolase